MKIICLSILFLLAFSAVAVSDDLAGLADTRKVSDKAVSLFKDEKFAEGYGILKRYWPLPPVEIDNLVNQTQTQWPTVKQRFGTSIAVEFVRETKVGASLVQYTYLQKFENHAIRWTLTFYRPRDRWVINSVSFDDEIYTLFAPQ